MNPRTRSRIPASIGSNQPSPQTAPSPPPPSSCYPAPWRDLRRRVNAGHGSLQQAGDYATPHFHHIRDGTGIRVGGLNPLHRATAQFLSRETAKYALLAPYARQGTV